MWDSIEGRVAGLALPELKALCKKNRMKVSGTKKELMERVIEAQMWGPLAPCPECGGNLRIKYPYKWGHGGQGIVSCPGRFDDDQFVPCHYSSTEAKRVAWNE
eukprot:TRINITY_DN1355_c0_g1_i4.p3 TRINITY_DN1355_c0_g1~~TRINITY_DN1355_c0_g1_i4.p3  ORF type:complete len:103 (+),score=29.80 TRINITY_DN1355_c0_g1_i4:276-584(+)